MDWRVMNFGNDPQTLGRARPHDGHRAGPLPAPALGRKPAQTIFVLVKVGMTNVLISPSLPSHQHAHDGNGARGQAFAHILSSLRMEKEIIHGGCEESMANCVDCVSVLSSCRLHVWCQYVNISFYPHPSRKCELQPVIRTRTQLSPML